MMRILALCLALPIASPAVADMRSIASEADLTPADMGHIFDSACFASTPSGILRSAKGMGAVLSLEDAYTEGSDADIALTDLSETLLLTASGDAREAVCAMRIDAAAAGDGADLYESVEAHLLERQDPLPEAEYVDGGLVWEWTTDPGTAFALSFVEAAEAFTLTLDAKRMED